MYAEASKIWRHLTSNSSIRSFCCKKMLIVNWVSVPIAFWMGMLPSCLMIQKVRARTQKSRPRPRSEAQGHRKRRRGRGPGKPSPNPNTSPGAHPSRQSPSVARDCALDGLPPSGHCFRPFFPRFLPSDAWQRGAGNDPRAVICLRSAVDAWPAHLAADLSGRLTP